MGLLPHTSCLVLSLLPIPTCLHSSLLCLFCSASCVPTTHLVENSIGSVVLGIPTTYLHILFYTVDFTCLHSGYISAIHFSHCLYQLVCLVLPHPVPVCPTTPNSMPANSFCLVAPSSFQVEGDTIQCPICHTDYLIRYFTPFPLHLFPLPTVLQEGEEFYSSGEEFYSHYLQEVPHMMPVSHSVGHFCNSACGGGYLGNSVPFPLFAFPKSPTTGGSQYSVTTTQCLPSLPFHTLLLPHTFLPDPDCSGRKMGRRKYRSMPAEEGISVHSYLHCCDGDGSGEECLGFLPYLGEGGDAIPCHCLHSI